MVTDSCAVTEKKKIAQNVWGVRSWPEGKGGREAKGSGNVTAE